MARTPTAAAVPAKSELTLLCERFQQQFGHLQPDGSPNSLMLNDVAEALGVPRRRLYDVINVFESIEV
jgi:NADH:ubiquinone oxidoreductase subunit E